MNTIYVYMTSAHQPLKTGVDKSKLHILSVLFCQKLSAFVREEVTRPEPDQSGLSRANIYKTFRCGLVTRAVVCNLKYTHPSNCWYTLQKSTQMHTNTLFTA